MRKVESYPLIESQEIIWLILSIYWQGNWCPVEKKFLLNLFGLIFRRLAIGLVGVLNGLANWEEDKKGLKADCIPPRDPEDLRFLHWLRLKVLATVLSALVLTETLMLKEKLVLYRIPSPVYCCTNIYFKIISLGKEKSFFVLWSCIHREDNNSVWVVYILTTTFSTFGPQVILHAWGQKLSPTYFASLMWGIS